MALPVTPATAGITAIPDPKRSPQSYQAYVAKQNADAQQAAMDKSNAQIQSGFQPILDFYAKQEADTSARYAKNAANLTSIFGALSGISAKDTTNINKQFESSVLKQQQDLATRTAEQRAAQTAGMAQLAQTGAERGNGPALGGSPTATATEAGIGQAQAIQQNWEGLMGAQQANAVTDITNRGEGYGQQEVAAQAQLTQNLQDALANIGGQRAGIEGQIAQAKVSRDQALASGQADAAAAIQRQIDEMDLQKLKNQGSLNVAQTAAAARLAAARSSGGTSTPKKPTYSKDLVGTLTRIGDTYGTGTAAELQKQLDNVQAQKNVVTANGAYNEWLKRFGSRINALPQAAQIDIKSTAKDYFNNLTYPKVATSTGVQPVVKP